MDQWRSKVFGPPVCWDTDSVDAFDEMAPHVTEPDVRPAVHVSCDLADRAARVQDAFDLGFDEVYLHFVGQDQAQFIDAFGSGVLPASPTPRRRQPTRVERSRVGRRV